MDRQMDRWTRYSPGRRTFEQMEQTMGSTDQASFKYTMGQNNQKSRYKYWANCSSVRSFTRTAHSFACSALLALLARFAALARSLNPKLVEECKF